MHSFAGSKNKVNVLNESKGENYSDHFPRIKIWQNVLKARNDHFFLLKLIINLRITSHDNIILM